MLRRAPQQRVAVLEKEPALARHQTGHNSGVIHTGVYYKPGSLKARLCVEGRAALLRFCDARGIPYALTGKLIVAVEERERPRLEDLAARGRANGVEGIGLLPGEAIRVPDPRYPFLGVHFTRRIDGDVWAGPNAVLALARERYGRTGFVLRDAADLAAWPGLWRVVGRHWRTGVAELWRDWVKEVYARDL